MRTRTSSLILLTVATLLTGAVTATASAAEGRGATSPRAALGYELHVPAFSVAAENASASAVSCSTSGYCVAVGFYARSTAEPSLALSWTRTTTGWHTGVVVPLPVGSTSTATSSLVSVSCSAPGTCLAVGTYKASATAPSRILAVRVLGGTAQRGVAINAPSGTKNPVPFAWCSPSRACEVAGTTTNAAGKGRLFTFSASLGGSLVWHTAPVLPPYAVPSGLPTPNNGGSLSATDLVCVATGSCLLVGSLHWSPSSGTLPFTALQVSGTWQRVRLAPLPGDAVARSNPEFGGALNSVSCAGTPPSLAVSHCIAVGTYFSTAGPRQLEEKEIGGFVTLGKEVTLPDEGVYLATACRSSNFVCIATGYSQIEGEAGAGSAYSIGTSQGFTTVSMPPLVVGGGDPFDWLTGGACLVGRATCVSTGYGVDNAASDPIVVTFTGLP